MVNPVTKNGGQLPDVRTLTSTITLEKRILGPEEFLPAWITNIPLFIVIHI